MSSLAGHKLTAEPTITKAGPAIEQLHELLGTVIPEHSISDVPIGVFLSGGIDSAVTAAYLDQPLTVTLASEVPHRNEAPAPAVERRQFTNSHDGLSPEATELAIAIDAYKARHRRRFINFDELLSVITALGYHR